MILTYERFSLFRNKKITQDDVDLVSDLFLEISDGLKEVSFSDFNDYDMEDFDGLEEDSFYFRAITADKIKGHNANGYISITVCLSFSDTENSLGGISWLSSELEEKQRKFNKKIHPFIDRLKKYKFKVSISLPEYSPQLYKLHITK